MSRVLTSWQLAAWLVLAGAFFWPAAAGGKDSDAGARSEGSSVEKIEAALGQAAEFDFSEQPLNDAVAFLKEYFAIEIQLDRAALEAAGTAMDTPVTLSVRKISLRSALNLLLRDLDLTWLIRDEVLWITTRDAADHEVNTKVYPVRDLALPPGGEGSEDYQSLVAAIVTTISPTTWNGAGGPGSLQTVPNAGAIVVSQTTSVHEALAELLESLRAARKAQFEQVTGR